MEWENELRQEFQKFADSIVWSNDDGSEKYIGIGNMADWWVKKIRSFLLSELTDMEKRIKEGLENSKRADEIITFTWVLDLFARRKEEITKDKIKQ